MCSGRSAGTASSRDRIAISSPTLFVDVPSTATADQQSGETYQAPAAVPGFGRAEPSVAATTSGPEAVRAGAAVTPASTRSNSRSSSMGTTVAKPVGPEADPVRPEAHPAGPKATPSLPGKLPAARTP